MKSLLTLTAIIVLLVLVASAGAIEPLFDTRVGFLVGKAPYTLVMADYDNDGTDELAVACRSELIAFMELDQAGGLTVVDSLPLTQNPFAMAAGDLDDDGDIDLAIGTSYDTVLVMENLAVDESDHDGSLPGDFRLAQNYPNPFNPGTTIRYELPTRTEVTLRIYNILGREIRTLVDRPEVAGIHTVYWDGTDSGGSRVEHRSHKKDGPATARLFFAVEEMAEQEVWQRQERNLYRRRGYGQSPVQALPARIILASECRSSFLDRRQRQPRLCSGRSGGRFLQHPVGRIARIPARVRNTPVELDRVVGRPIGGPVVDVAVDIVHPGRCLGQVDLEGREVQHPAVVQAELLVDEIDDERVGVILQGGKGEILIR